MRPEICLYCDGQGNGPGSPCGFCENGVPLDTQEDWDNSWGKAFWADYKGTRMREKLVSVTKDDFELQTFRAGGKGGQGQNKRSTGVRLIHKASGARGEARDQRSFDQNKKNAFLRLIETKEFKSWLKIQNARALGRIVEIEEYVERAMNPKNLRVEVKDEKGRWTPE